MNKPFKVPCGPTVFVDVDDTLLMWDLPEGIDLNDDRLVLVNCRGHKEKLMPNKHNIELLKKMAKRGHAIIVWSGGGADWAEACLLYTSPSPRDVEESRMPSSA